MIILYGTKNNHPCLQQEDTETEAEKKTQKETDTEANTERDKDRDINRTGSHFTFMFV